MRYRMMIAALITAVTFIGCGGGNQEADPQLKSAAAVVVETTPVRQADFPVTLRLGGSLRGDRQTLIPARVTTTVTEIPVKVGQRVRQNDLLVMLDPGGVQSQYRQMEALFRNAEKRLANMKNLFEAGAISETQLDAAQTEYEVAKANFNSARQSIEIEAPFDGIITDIYVRVGDEVSPGTPVIEVADVRSLRLLLEASTGQAAQLKAGQRVQVRSPLDSAVVMTGSVFSVADAANQATRSFEVECHFPAPPKGFAPGMYVISEIETMTLSSVLIVPNGALLYRSGAAMLYAVDGDTAVLVMVTEMASGDGLTAVRGDISAGQRVVVVGQKNLTPGASVREAGK